MNDITYAVSVDVNNPITPYNVYVASVLDSNVRYLEITLYQNGNVIALSNTATATASLVTDNVLVNDSVECTISNNIISVPLEDLQRHGNLDVQVTVTEGEKVLAIPFPIQVRVTPNIAEEAQIDNDSLGSYAEVVREIAAARGDCPDLKDRLNGEIDRIDDDISGINTALAAKANTVEVSAANLAVYQHLSVNYYDKDELDGEIDRIDVDVSALQDALLHSYYEIALATEWEQGGISTNGVEDDTLTGKKRSGFIDATQFDSISKVNATGINVVYYNADTTFGRFTWIASGASALVDHTYPYIRFSVASSVNAGDIHLYKNIPLKTDVDALKSARHFDFVTLLPGMSGFLDYNTVEGTLTIPKDTLLIGYNADGVKTYKAINPSAAIVLTGVNYTSLHSSAVKLLLNTDSYTFLVKTYTQAQAANEYPVATIRLKHSTYQPSIFSPLSWTIDGVPFGIQPNHLPFAAFKKSKAVRGINHRGWHEAPENTLTAFRLSRRKGFDYVETDVQFTSDGVPVLLHDDTINRTARTSNGGTIAESIDIGSITYAAASAYDYGIWKGAGFAGEPLPTFEEFIVLCRNLGLTPYVEIKKALTASQAATLLNIVRQNGMKGHVVWISFTKANLELFKSNDPVAVMGLLCTTVTQEIITDALNLKTDTNEVFVNANITNITDERIALCVNAGLPLSVWTVDQESAIISANPYITGITSNKFDAGLVLYNAGISVE